MELPGLYRVEPHDEDLIVSLAKMASEAYMEEQWMLTLLEALPPESAGRDRKRYLAEAFVLNELAVSAPYQGVYCLHDGSALAQAYLKSELSGLPWQELEDKALADLVKSVLSEDEANTLTARIEAMKPISNFSWMDHEDTKDYIHLVFLAVDKAKRGSGAFRRLIEPFFAYADAASINIYLETYCDRLEGLYGHFGFEVVHRFQSPLFGVYERAMVRRPQSTS